MMYNVRVAVSECDPLMFTLHREHGTGSNLPRMEGT